MKKKKSFKPQALWQSNIEFSETTKCNEKIFGKRKTSRVWWPQSQIKMSQGKKRVQLWNSGYINAETIDNPEKSSFSEVGEEIIWFEKLSKSGEGKLHTV